ncbi:hypothetical protein V498_10604 [Pseudogymnoascus sp. VKM F-4517 (FW-2822)]|nr:hypothetical protein V498_10604 [Pseudogymnoascus sp. VKM F-4517 (FW-2822)]
MSSLRKPGQSTSRRDQLSRPAPQIHNYYHPRGGYGAEAHATTQILGMEEPDIPKGPISPPSIPTSRPDSVASGMNEANSPDAPSLPSRKRSSSSQTARRPSEEPVAKKLRTAEPEDATTVTAEPPSTSWDDLITAVPYTKPLFAEEPQYLLERSAALILNHVGFDGASKEALESICAQASAYADKFLSYVTESMLSCRRAQPIPLDYEYALRRHGLTDSLLRPHLKPPVPRSKTQLVFEVQEPEIQDTQVLPELLGHELSGAVDKLTKPFIPKQFPAFPSKHTYKATEVMPDRETDPRKIREKATEASRHGEEALRRLVGVGKVGDQKGVRKSLLKSPARKHRNELWDLAMQDLKLNTAKATAAKPELDGTERGILIDAGRKYGRQSTTRAKN